ncbi:MAG TPA: SpoIID/LytB domain-containing protein [Ignavibacteriaceae bacterium]|nr:SpoIID/LytB domain-containing protein [Ignavibacteriaceae bacterium]
MNKKKIISFCVFITGLILSGCSSSPKFTSNGDDNFPYRTNSGYRNSYSIRVLMNGPASSFTWTAEEKITVYIEDKRSAIVNPGNELIFTPDDNDVNLVISGREFSGTSIRLISEDEDGIIKFNRKDFRGSIKIISNDNLLTVVNSLSLEDYLKGVLPLEMPSGRGDENFEALKAMAVCARTYSINKIGENKPSFDVYLDTRDQVYGGMSSEKDITNKAIDETSGMILTFDGKPAITFYSASCGGHTEDVKNVFSYVNSDIPYLKGVKDGEEPYCSITPRFEWEENYSYETIINRLRSAGLVTGSDISLENIEVVSRFESGRVNELKIELSVDDDDRSISIFSNQIRSVIRTANDSGILRSTMFDITQEGDSIKIWGRGYGHGVGLCQWGTIYLSHEGWNYKSILEHYFPGTDIKRFKND